MNFKQLFLKKSSYLANNTSDASVFVYDYIFRVFYIIFLFISQHITSHTSSRHTPVHVTHRFTSHISSCYISVHVIYHHTMESLLGREFETISKARDTITSIIINAGLSYKKFKSTRTCYILIYKNNTCMNITTFKIELY